MARFRFKASGVDGRIVQGQMDASSHSAALDTLLARGQTPLEIQPANGGSALRDWLKPEVKEFSVKDAAEFSGDVARLLSSGFSLYQALQMTSVSSASKAARSLAERAAETVQKGGSLYSMLSKETSGPALALAGLVQAGEAAGELDKVLGDASKSFGASAEFKEKLGSALIYPMIILFMISLTLMVFFTFVLPRLQPLFDDIGDRLPLATRLLLGFGQFCEIWGPWLALIGLIFVVALRVQAGFRKRVKRYLDQLLLGRLGFGSATLAGFAAYARTLGLLLSSGVPLTSANSVAAGAVANSALSEKFDKLTSRLRGGENLSTLFETLPETPEVLTRMTFIGERSGKLGPALNDAAGILERAARTRMDRLMAALTPIVTIFLGLIVALVVGSLFIGLAALTEIDV